MYNEVNIAIGEQDQNCCFPLLSMPTDHPLVKVFSRNSVNVVFKTWDSPESGLNVRILISNSVVWVRKYKQKTRQIYLSHMPIT